MDSTKLVYMNTTTIVAVEISDNVKFYFLGGLLFEMDNSDAVSSVIKSLMRRKYITLESKDGGPDRILINPGYITMFKDISAEESNVHTMDGKEINITKYDTMLLKKQIVSGGFLVMSI